jgi:hypothetical protein
VFWLGHFVLVTLQLSLKSGTSSPACALQVDRRAAVPRSPSRFLGGLTAASPFASAAYSQQGCVHAFEIPFATIRGVDYSNPLCLEGRLVLEAASLRKREFPTVGGASVPAAPEAA